MAGGAQGAVFRGVVEGLGTGLAISGFDQLVHECLALREEVSVLRRCLADSGVISTACFDVELHKMRFAAALRRSGWSTDACMERILSAGELMSASLEFFSPAEVWAVRTAARALRRSADLFFGGHIPGATDGGLVKLHVLGGSGPLDEGWLPGERYNSCTSVWEELPPVPLERIHGAAAVIRGDLYLCGGFAEASRSLQRFNCALGVWQELPPMAEPRSSSSAVALGSRLHIVGGIDGEGFTLRSVIRFDPQARRLGVWEALAPLLESRHGHVTAALKGSILACGGLVDHAGVFQRVLGSAEILDPGSQRGWAPLPQMLAQRGGHVGAAVAGAVCVCGGTDTPVAGEWWQPLASAERFDLAAGAWTALPPMSVPRVWAAAAVVAGRLCVCGGTGDDDAELQSAECLDLRSAEESACARPSWRPLPPLLVSRSRHVAASLAA